MADFATSNRFALDYVEELVYNTTPANPAFKPLRITGESISDNISTVESQELRSDRQTADIVTVDASPGGDANIELSAESFDDIIEALMMSTWSADLAIVGVAADLVLITTGNHLTSTTTDKFINVVVGQHIKLAGFSTSSGTYRVVTKPDNQTLTLFPAPPVASTPTGTTGSIVGSMIRNGVEERSFALLKRFLDTSPVVRHIFNGQRVKALNLALKTGSIITGSVSFMGSTATMGTTAISGETFADAAETTPMNSVDNVAQLLKNGVASSPVLSFDMTFDNQHRELKAIQTLGNIDVRGGTFMAKGTLSQYFLTTADYLLFKASTHIRFTIQLSDVAGNSYLITYPRAKYTEFAMNASGKDTEVMAESAFSATRDPATNCMVQIDRFVA